MARSREDLGAAVRRRSKARGLTHTVLAERTNTIVGNWVVSQLTVRSVETARTNAPEVTMWAPPRGLGQDPAYLERFRDGDEPPRGVSEALGPTAGHDIHAEMREVLEQPAHLEATPTNPTDSRSRAVGPEPDEETVP